MNFPDDLNRPGAAVGVRCDLDAHPHRTFFLSSTSARPAETSS